MDYDSRMSRATRHWILLIVAVAGTMQMLASAFGNSYNSRLFWAAYGGPQPGLIRRWAAADKALDSALAGRTGNIMADFGDTREVDDPDGLLRSFFFVRAIYKLWPTRIYISDTVTPLVFHDSVAAARLPSDPTWPAKHQITTRLHLGLGPGDYDVRARAEPQGQP